MFKLELRLQNIAIKGFTIEDGGRVTIGRDPGNDIIIDDSTVSREHAYISREGDNLVVFDKGSKSGTIVNGEKLESARLKNADIVRIGANHTIRISITPEEREPTMTIAALSE